MKTEQAMKRIKKCPACGSEELIEDKSYEYRKWCQECNFDIDKDYIENKAEMGKALATRLGILDTALGAADGDEWDEARALYFAEKEKVAKKIKALEKELQKQTNMQAGIRRLGSIWDGQLRE